MKWIRHVRDHCDAPPDVKALLMVMATYADGDGVCWPSLERLARNLGVHPDTAKRRRNRAVELGWLVIVTPGRWKGYSTRYQLQTKGGVDAPLPIQQRGASVAAKGVHEGGPKGGVGAPRTTKKFQEGDVSTPFLGTTHSSPTEQRRLLARQIREAINPTFKERFQKTFDRDYGHLYGKEAA